MKRFKHRNIDKEFRSMISNTLVVFDTEDDTWDIIRIGREKPVQMSRFYRIFKVFCNDRKLIRELVMSNITYDKKTTDDSLWMLIYDMIDVFDFMSEHEGKAYLVKVLVFPQMVVRLVPVSTVDENEIKASFWKAMDNTPIV